MLSTSKLVGFVATTRPSEAKQFYGTALGLPLVEEGPYALVFAASEATLRVQKVEAVAKAPYTALGWVVSDIVATARWLTKRGVELVRYEGLPQDELGIWRTPDGSGVAWFCDPDGNTLSITEHRAK
jgi:predicted enzyme related to lactoylglutathione lyase